MRVLVAEDFEVRARSIGTGLRRGGMAVDVVLDGADALEHLAVTASAGGRVGSAEELLGRVWDGMADPFTTAVKSTVRRLRAKLGDPPVIGTVREGGYRIGDA